MSSHRPTPPLELFGLDSLIGGDEREVASAVRRFVEQRVSPHIADWYETGAVPVRELAVEAGALGMLGMHLEGYGCAGMSALAYGLTCLELEAGDSGLRSLVSVQGSLAMFALWKYGSEDQRREWLPRMAEGRAIGCFGLTEADFGSNPAGMRTRARRDGGDWILTGSKMWITNGSVADVVIVWAQTQDGVRGFVVPAGTPGFTARTMTGKLSLRASITAELVMDDVRLPVDAILPLAQGLAAPLSCLDEARFGISFGALGAARDCLDTALRYAGEREVFGKPLAGHQLTQAKLADMTLELGKCMLLAIQLARLKDSIGVTSTQVSLGKLSSSRAAIAIARECRTILGAAGISLEYPVLRHANNLESVLTYEGTAEIHQLAIGRELTGASAYR